MNKVLIILALISFKVWAQEELEAIQVSSDFHTSSLVEFLPSVTTLQGNELKKRRELSLGDTLRNEAGVTSSTFGPNAGRPIIRGIEGDRIRILQNGLGVLDASAQSPDHSVPVDTLIVDSIEIVRGPMSLLYGSNAVGGVVNVTTNRVHTKFEEGVLSEVQTQGESAFNSLATGFKTDYGVNNWMFHFDGSYRNANDQAIPGDARSKRIQVRQPLPAGESEDDKKLENSHGVQKSLAVGASKIYSQGYAGLSFYHFDNYYGAVSEEEVQIKMKQNRVEFHSEYQMGGDFLEKLRFKSAQSFYDHREIEAGETATTFQNQGNESRLEFFTKLSDVKGISGLQNQYYNFKAAGEEAYLPSTRNIITSAFTMQELMQKKNTYSVGARVESGHIEDESSTGKEKNFVGKNGSLGYKHQFTDPFSAGLSLSYTERLPNFQELFANGNHIATGAFERGDDGLNKERAYGTELVLNYKDNRSTAALNFYTQQFKDYIALLDTGVADTDPDGEGFNFFDYDQVDALFYGMDFDARHQLEKSSYTVFSKADWVRGKNKDNGTNLPRLSPPRVTIGIEKTLKKWIGDIEAQYNFMQTKTAPGELRTDEFTLLNAGIRYEMLMNEKRLSLFARVRNLLNQEARLHTSTLKEIAPLPGRNFIGGVQYLF